MKRTTPIANLMLSIMGYFAEFERQREEIRLAKIGACIEEEKESFPLYNFLIITAEAA